MYFCQFPLVGVDNQNMPPTFAFANFFHEVAMSHNLSGDLNAHPSARDLQKNQSSQYMSIHIYTYMYVYKYIHIYIYI